MLEDTKARNAQTELAALWWLFGIEGLFSVAFGLIARLLPSAIASIVLMPASLLFFVILCGLYVISCALASLIASVYAFDHHLTHAKLILVEGCVALLLGLYIELSLALSIPALSMVFAIQAGSLGVFRLLLLFKLKHQLSNHVVIAAAAGFAFLASAFFVVTRNSDTKHLIGWIAVYSLISGLLDLGTAIRLRHVHLQLPL